MTVLTASNPDEFHIALNVPKHVARALHRWAKDQKWPQGTKLEDPKEYHCTLLYSKQGHDDHADSWWVPSLDNIAAKIAGFANFGPDDDNQTAYVLRLGGDQLQSEGEKTRDSASKYGVHDTHPDEYKPHITIGYGPSPATGINPPQMELVLGPSSVSTPRKTSNWHNHYDEAAPPQWHFGDFVPEDAQLLHGLSLNSVAHNLHYKYEQGVSPNDMANFAGRLLKLIGYPEDPMTTQAALQAWQTMYPQDRQLEATPNTPQLNAGDGWDIPRQSSWSFESTWNFDSPFEQLIDQYSPYGLSVLYDEDPDTINISHLEVDPNQRNRGIGSRFMNDAYRHAQDFGKKLMVSRVDNVPFFNKFPFLNRQETTDKPLFVTAAWEDNDFISGGGWDPSSIVAATHSSQNVIPGDSTYFNAPLNNFMVNPNAGVHKSYINDDNPFRTYIKTERPNDFHSSSPLKERAAFVLGNAMGLNVPHTVVRPVSVPAHNYYGFDNPKEYFELNPDALPGQGFTNYASVHHGVPNAQTLGARWADELVSTDQRRARWLERHQQARRNLTLFDQIIGNNDRHSGNILIDNDDKWYPIDHGGAFSPSDNIPSEHYINSYDFYGQPLTDEELARLEAAQNALDDPAHSAIFNHKDLNPRALHSRMNKLLESGRFLGQQPFFAQQDGNLDSSTIEPDFLGQGVWAQRQRRRERGRKQPHFNTWAKVGKDQQMTHTHIHTDGHDGILWIDPEDGSLKASNPYAKLHMDILGKSGLKGQDLLNLIVQKYDPSLMIGTHECDDDSHLHFADAWMDGDPSDDTDDEGPSGNVNPVDHDWDRYQGEDSKNHHDVSIENDTMWLP